MCACVPLCPFYEFVHVSPFNVQAELDIPVPEIHLWTKLYASLTVPIAIPNQSYKIIPNPVPIPVPELQEQDLLQ